MTFTGRPGWSALRAALAVPLLALAGCGGADDDGLDRQAVSGTVTMAGQPLEKGTIQFLPDGGDASKAIGGGAPITAGSYAISAEEGLPPGNYIVSISAPAGGADQGGDPGSGAKLPKETIPSKYNTATTLKAQVKSGETNAINFELTP
jgi:hypothetical protein